MGRTCATCVHPAHEAIDKALLAGEPYRSVAKRYEASPPSVYRHWQDHLPAALVKAREAGEIAHGDDLLTQLRDLQGKALGILAQAEKAADLRTALMAVREVRGTLELVGKVTGQMVTRTEHSSTDGHPINITEVVIFKNYGPLSDGRHIIDVVDGHVVRELPAPVDGDGVGSDQHE